MLRIEIRPRPSLLRSRCRGRAAEIYKCWRDDAFFAIRSSRIEKKNACGRRQQAGHGLVRRFGRVCDLFLRIFVVEPPSSRCCCLRCADIIYLFLSYFRITSLLSACCDPPPQLMRACGAPVGSDSMGPEVIGIILAAVPVFVFGFIVACCCLPVRESERGKD